MSSDFRYSFRASRRQLLHGRDGVWSRFYVIGHLIHGERTDWMPRVKIVLHHGEARAFDTFDRFAQFRASEGRTLANLLDEFATLRRENLRELAMLQLTDADLDLAGGTQSSWR